MKRIISILLTFVLVISSFGPGISVYATSTIPTFSATNGIAVFEAEDVQLNDSRSELVADENASRSVAVKMTNEPDNVAFLGKNYPNNLDWFGGKEGGNPVASVEPSISFDFVPDQAGTYYVWVRVLCSVKSQVSVWFSRNNERYKYELYNSNDVTNVPLSDEYQWVKCVYTVDVAEGKENTAVNLRFLTRNLGMQWDKFLITNNAEYTPEGMNPTLPDAPAPTFRTENGTVMFEAENTKLYDFNSELVTDDENASGNTAVQYTNEEYGNSQFVKNTYPDDAAYQALFTKGGNPVAAIDPGLEVNVVPDQAGTYYVWVRLICESKYQNTLYVSVNNANYGYEDQPTGGFSSEYQWVRLKNTVVVDDSGVDKEINLRFRGRKCGMIWDKLIITNDAEYTPEGKDPALPEVKIPTYNAVNGSVLIEAEKTALNKDYTKLVTGEESEISRGKGVELTNTPAVAFDSAKTENDSSQFNEKGFPIASVPGGVSFNFVPDVAGRYRIWVRQKAVRSDGACTIWCSIDNTTYTMATTHGPDNRDYYWVSLISFDVAEEDVGNPINFRFRGRFIGEVWDQIVITASLMYEPEGISPELPTGGGLGYVELPQYTDSNGDPVIPSMTPTTGEHPRLLFTESDIHTIRDNLTHPENAEAYALFLELKDKECDGILNADLENNYDAQVLQIIEAKAFDYVINGNVQNGEEAIAAIKNYLTTYKNPDASTYYAEAGYGIYTAAEVYDWCYDLLDDDEKEEIVAKSQMVAMLFMSIGFPPSTQSAFVSHGSEQQLLRDWMALGIATYDEYPGIYNYVVARYETEYVPARDYFYKSGGHYQGNYYGPFRFTWDLWAQTMLVNMSKTDDVEMIYTPKTQQVLYQWIYARRPDGEMFREGDDGNERYPEASQWYKTTNYPFFLAANFYKDGILKNEFMTNAEYPGGKGGVSAVQMLALNDTTIKLEGKTRLPLSKYISDPIGAMYARTGWNVGTDASDVLAYMKIGQTWASNHVHRDAGNFQIYYKGILASESGEYQIYNDNHNELYNQSSIAHNTLGITSSSNPTGVQRIPNKASGNTGTQYDTIDELIADAEDNTTGEVIGQEFGPDLYTPAYTYIAGDIADAYDSNVKEAVRSMLFLPMDNGDYPAVFVVFDRITTTEVGSTKTFMLHMQSEPTIQDNVVVITNTATDYNGTYNGKLTNQTLLGYYDNNITAIGGAGHRFEVGGVNYEPNNFRYSEEGMEEGWGRVEISITTTKANQTDYFLNVMYVNDADQTVAFERAKLIEADNVYGAKIFDRVAIFNKEKARIEGSITFEIPADSDVTTYQVNVAGVKDGTWTITTSDGQTQTAVASVDGGILYFNAPAGTCTVTWAGEDNDKEFTENQPEADDGYSIKVNDSYIFTPVKAIIENDELYLPVEALFGAMGGTVTEEADAVVIEYRGNMIRLTAEKAVITPAGRSSVESTDVKVIEGAYLLPDSSLQRALGGYMDVTVNELLRVVDITETDPDDIEVQGTTQFDNTEASSSILNALDGDMVTYWGVSGQNGVELGIFDLGHPYILDEIKIALHQGNVRTTSFDLYVSEDGVTYTKVGETRTSSGTTLDFESYGMEGVRARYVKICGYGFNKNGTAGVWNSFKEIAFVGKIVPEIIEAETNKQYVLDSDMNVKIHCTAPYYDLESVKVDGVTVEASNYVVSEGSTIVEFTAEYLDSLSVGDHTVSLCYSNSRTAAVTLTVRCEHKVVDTIPAVPATCTGTGLTEGKVCSTCGHTTVPQVTVPETGHNYDNGVITTPASCTQPGVKTFTCQNDAKHTYTEPVTETGHTEGTPVEENVHPASCTQPGSYESVVYCTVCDTELSREPGVIPEAGHKDENSDYYCDVCQQSLCTNHQEIPVAAVAPTCTVSGLTEGIKCSLCGHIILAQEVVPALGHNYDSGVVTTPVTCTLDGVKTFTCQNDAKHTYTEPISATGHSYDDGVITTPATCTQPGVKTYTCQNDATHTYTEPVSALGHIAGEPVTENTVAATCISDGSYESVVYCTVCTSQINRTTIPIPATGHHYDEGVVTLAPTCTETGVMTFTCQNNEKHTYTAPIAALGHDYDSGVVVLQPTCTQKGEKVYTCQNDESHFYKETIAANGHKNGAVVLENEQPATCTTNGSRDEVVYCSTCNQELKRSNKVIPAVGHSDDNGDYLCDVCKVNICTEHIEVTIAAVPATCTSTGLTEGKKCERCGVVTVEQISVPATGHDYDDGVVIAAATCTQDGTKKFTCKNDETHTYTEPITATGHAAGETVKENEKAATSTEAGSYDAVKYCKNCDAELSRETIEIPIIETPQTGDSTFIFGWFLLLVFFLVMLVCVVMYYLKVRVQ